MKKHQWHKSPARGFKHQLATHYRFTVVRLSDGAERFTNRLPRVEIRKSPDFMAWDNQFNSEVR